MKKGVLSLAALAISAAAMAQFTPGRLVVVVFGDGITALGSASAPAFLQEYTTAGALGVNVPLPTASAGANRACTVRGASTSEGFLARSTDGRFITVMGFDAPAGTAAISTTDASVINRVIARVDASATIDTSTTFAAYTGQAPTSNGDPRAAVTVDGSAFWTNGNAVPSANGGVWYSALGGSGTQVSNNVPNGRVVKIFNNQLYVSSGSALLTGVGTVGTGLPTGTGETVTTYINTAGIGVGFGSPYDFHFADANTCYIADDRSFTNGGGIQKWTYDSGTSTWSLAYTLNNNNTLGGTRGIAAVTEAGMTTLYVTTSTEFYTVMDMGVASPFVLLATAATNTAFRGVAWAPQNPSTPVIIDPTGGTPGPGSTIGGTPADMLISDDIRWQIRPGAVLVATNDPVAVRIVGTAPGTTPSALTVTIESSASVTNVRQIVEAQKADDSYVQLESFTGLPTATDRTVTLPITSPALYIRAGNEVAIRIKAKNTTAVLVYPWRYRIDRMYWTYTP